MNDRKTNPPAAACPSWCDRTHPTEPSELMGIVSHTGIIGTGLLQGETLTVQVNAVEYRGQIGDPGVSIRWPHHPQSDGLPEAPPPSGLDGIDMTDPEAEVLAALLVQAAVTIRTAGRR